MASRPKKFSGALSHIIESLTPLDQDSNSTQQTGHLKSCFDVPLLFDFDRKKERQEGWGKRKKRQEIGRGFKTTTTATKEALYGAYIDELVLKCNPKIARCNSGSETIRQQAALYCLKAAFCNFHKAELVKEMMKADVRVKKYQMHYYLNKKFFYALRTASKNLDA